jgi:hypothetical protein
VHKLEEAEVERQLVRKRCHRTLLARL